MIIYLMLNRITGKVYVGQTRRALSVRVRQHCYSREPLGCSIRKHGIDSFSLAVIDGAGSLQELNAKEIAWISFYKSMAPNGYNVTRGGDGTVGVRHSTESRKRQSEKAKVLGIGGWNRGTIGAVPPKSLGTREKLSKALKGVNRGKKRPKFGREADATTF